MGKSKNRILRLKQFSVRDDRCAMKVGTDALILGAWAELPAPGLPMLDVGTGSGILALMAAQRSLEGPIIAVELDSEAAAQARENVGASPFASRIRVEEVDFLQFAQNSPWAGRCGAVWLNPPYFRDKPASPDPARTRARHESALPLVDWFPACARLLTATGSVSVVWPIEREEELIHVASGSGFSAVRLLAIRGRSDGPVIRLAAVFSRNPIGDVHRNELSIEERERTDGPPLRSAAYLNLLEPFVLSDGDPRRFA